MQQSSHSKIPFPVSLQLYNLFPGHLNPQSDHEEKPATRRLEYSLHLVKRPIQASLVEIITTSPFTAPNATASTSTTITGENPRHIKVWYKFPLDESCGTCPCWPHLSEVLDWKNMDRSTYERMNIRLTVMEDDDEFEDDGNINESNHTRGKYDTYFLQIPLHPSKLIPLSKGLPPNRPINTAVVQFSDESVRITPQCWDQFKQQSLAVADEKLLRFEEGAFQALDSVVPSSSSPASLLDAAEALEAMASRLTITATKIAADNVPPSPESAMSKIMDEMSHLPTESSAEIATLLREREIWQKLVQVEQDTLQFTQQGWQDDQECLRETLQLLRTKRDHTMQIEKATREEELECQRLTLHLEAQRIRLVKELRQIYPISGVGGVTDGLPKAGKIRGLVLPRDLFSVPEDDLSAALGFLCHAVTLLSRYLSVPLRYRLYCNSSRSAVQDDRGTVFPLFQARPVEREQVESGVLLLERNLECVGSYRGIRWERYEKSSLHILEKLDLIYSVVIDGEYSK